MENSVKNKLNDEAYELLQLPHVEFKYGDIIFFDDKSIDSGQAGFRYNGLTGEPISDWTGDEYVVIGYDSTAGLGPDPYIVKTDDPNLPVYWLMTDGGDWSDPDLICDSLKKFNQIFNVLGNYSEYFVNEELTSELKEQILSEIHNIENQEISNYWSELLDRAIPMK